MESCEVRRARERRKAKKSRPNYPRSGGPRPAGIQRKHRGDGKDYFRSGT
jgi:hypothetical protein